MVHECGGALLWCMSVVVLRCGACCGVQCGACGAFCGA